MMKENTRPSIKRNFAYKSILTISTYLMGFITFPYISRVFGVENLGLVNFVDNTVSYFLLFATMGISNIGIREIAAVKHDQKERSRVFSNLLGVNLLFTVVTLAVYLLVILLVPKFNQHIELFYIGTAKILFSAFMIEWLYSGLENFRYITIRSLLIKSLYVLAVFAFIRRPDQYKIYFLLTVLVTVFNSIVNLLHSSRYVDLVWKEVMDFRYIRSNLTLGVYNIMTSMYLTFNVMYLGLVCNNEQVGYYTSAFKLYTIILSVFGSFTSVMLPRMSSLLAQGREDEFRSMISRSFEYVYVFSIPLILCTIVMSPQIIHVICGPGYDGAVLPMRIIMPAVLSVGIAQVLAIQVLMPKKKDNVLLYASFAGASVSILINVCAVSFMGASGSAMVLLFSEITVTMYYLIYVMKERIVEVHLKHILHNILKAIPLAAVCLICAIVFENPFVSLPIAVCASVVIWVLMNMRFIKFLR